jgi:uncharacterized protein HemX
MSGPPGKNVEPMPAPPWVEFFKEAISPVVDTLAELKAEYQVDRDEWIARLDEIDQRLDDLARRVERIERQLAKGAGP